MMTLRQLRYLQALSETEHFGRAARRVGVTQPALSAQIRELEEDLGEKLIERRPSGARLTAFGAQVAERGARILGLIQEIESLSDRYQGPLAGPLRLGVIPSVGPYLLPRLLPFLKTALPDVQLRLRETITETLVAELLADRLDCIIASLPLGEERLEEASLFEDPFWLAVPEGGRLARSAFADLEALSSEDLILLEEGHCMRDQILSYCRIPPSADELSVTNLATIIELIEIGAGVSLLPSLFAEANGLSGRRVTLLPFADPGPRRQIGLAWRHSHPGAGQFRDLAGKIAAWHRGTAAEGRPVARGETPAPSA
ncbi:hydrogen peroxide-inducible genes activator [Afifella sp. IM 167]|uniref:hydrogen peroxide-inducible genes activator n=1 Tax=Afifella sp. IM 167 TaxID=2033586 RepID=UPI001CCAD2C0|nr:hydrogen peroxide-inducible genes activator [Afifella sp. IM 167]MBZ8131694.1 LysR family transcriptional regulator [Afifella sp. IM 167]